MLGIPDGAVGVLWPSMRQSFHLPLDDLGVPTIAGTVLYFSGSLLGHRVHDWLGVGGTMVTSCIVALAGLVGWSLAPSWSTVVIAVATLGLARGVIDAVVNAEAAFEGGVRRLGILHGCWAIGGTLGPILVASVVTGPGKWRLAVVVIAAGVLVLLPVALADARRSGRAERPAAGGAGETTGAARTTGAAGDGRTDAEPAAVSMPSVPPPAPPEPPSRSLILAITVFAFGVYTAAESGPIAWGYTYLILDRHLSHLVAAGAMAGFWAALTLGRFALAALGDRAAGTFVLEMSCLVFAAGISLFWLLPGVFSVVGLPVAGLGSAAIFPVLVALTPRRIGTRAAGRAIGASVAASALGGPIAVTVLGLAAAHFGVRVLGVCMCALAILLYCVNRALSLFSPKVQSCR